ncbi:MAG TPA: beta-ketoacyl-[acyl-carrier-protein] synthase family protein [Steroidobacteraceae bacterium]|nr:beta-ketoacyl-[acyl-carrier-protein] synthase family protein [Steroidobacteraceae bacterium]
MKPLAVNHLTATSCIGTGLAATLGALQSERGGLTPCHFEMVELDTYVGEVRGLEHEPLPSALAPFESRNNRLAWLGLRQDGFVEAVARSAARFGPRRVGVFLGTSTSGMLETEIAYQHRNLQTGALPAEFNYAGSHNCYSVAAFTREALGLEGPAAVISTACSSSAKVFGAAQRMMAAGVIDAAVVGGVDSLCLTTLYGFHSLQLTSRWPCRPFDVVRDGISIGEAAAFALLEPVAPAEPQLGIGLFGVGESSDAYHLSSPHPQGQGARVAMQRALQSAAIAPAAIDYINLHGTGTISNDIAESLAVEAVFGRDIACSSTKGATGHALGAAGALEAVICALALQHEFLPGGLNLQVLDPACHLRYLAHNCPAIVQYAVSNSFGFGGTNCSLIFGLLD